MNDPGRLPKLAWLPIDRLAVDPAYQRSLDSPRSQKLIDRIATEFDWLRFGALMAVVAGEQRWLVIDGQHRMTGAMRRGDIRRLPAVVYEKVDRAAQAAAFVGANRDRVAMSAQALYHAQLAAGDAEAVAIARICERVGIKTVRFNLAARQIPAMTTAAVPAFRTLVRLYGEQRAGEAISAVVASLGRYHGGLRSPFFLAAGRFLAARCGDAASLESALRKIGLSGLDAAGRGFGGNTQIAELTELLRRTAMAARSAPAAAPRLSFSSAPRPAPPPAHKPKSAVPVTKQPKNDDRAVIDRFLAEKGARLVMSPEQAAAFLRDCGHRCSIIEAVAQINPRIRPREAEIKLDGKPATLSDVYQAVNAARAATGLAAVEGPGGER